MKSERGHAQVWGHRKVPGRIISRLTSPPHGRAFFTLCPSGSVGRLPLMASAFFFGWAVVFLVAALLCHLLGFNVLAATVFALGIWLGSLGLMLRRRD